MAQPLSVVPLQEALHECLLGPTIEPHAEVEALRGASEIANLPLFLNRLSGYSPFYEPDPQETEARIVGGRFDAFQLYPNTSQSATLFLRKVLSVHPW